MLPTCEGTGGPRQGTAAFQICAPLQSTQTQVDRQAGRLVPPHMQDLKDNIHGKKDLTWGEFTAQTA